MPEIPRHSHLIWRTSENGPGDTPGQILASVVERLRELNRLDPARELSLAVTHCQEAGHWLRTLDERKST
jgi:hypothetical protein